MWDLDGRRKERPSLFYPWGTTKSSAVSSWEFGVQLPGISCESSTLVFLADEIIGDGSL
jgi:hypothetical protein